MITPDEARQFATQFDNDGWVKPEDCKVADLIRDLAQQVEDLQADAKRYRWLRLNPAWESEAFLSALSPEGFDLAVSDQMRDL
jgi:hypothetical protein